LVYVTFFATFIVAFLSVPFIRFFAFHNGAVALPGKRHIHTHPTPKFGGIAIALSVILVSPFVFTIDRAIGSYLAASSIMLLLGIVDDVRHINWKVKLVFSILATSIIIFGAGVWIKSLGNLFGFGEIYLGLWGVPFTLFAVFGVVNAINLIDGMNGLACGVSSIAFLSFAILASASGNETVFYISVANLGATLGLFRYNYPKATIFMGDSGSMFLGFSLAIMAIFLTQGQGSINPMVPVLILGIPVFDAIRILLIRLQNSKHPFYPDRAHLHHLIYRSGLAKNKTVHKIWLLTAVMSIIALTLHNFDDWIMFCIFILMSISLGFFIRKLRIIKTRKNGTSKKFGIAN